MERQFSVLLVNGWSDDNKGDAAIVEGLIQLIRTAASTRGLAPTIDLMSSFPANIDMLRYHYRHTSMLSRPVAVHGSLLPTVRMVGEEARKSRRRVRAAWLIVRSLLLLAAPKALGGLLLNRQERSGLSAMEAADLVVSKGGHILVSSGTLLSLIGLYENAFPLLLASRLRRPAAIFGQSIGPVNGRLQRLLLCRLMRGLLWISAREPLTAEYVAQLVGRSMRPSLNLRLSWDTAFVIQSRATPSDLSARLPSRFAAMTVRPWHFPYNPGRAREMYARYIGALADAVVYVNERLSLPVVVLPQVIGPVPNENDMVAVGGLVHHLKGRRVDLQVIEEDLTAGQLRAVYGRAEFLVGTRFHSVILALSSGTPAVVISYHGYKSTGIMKMLGMERFVVEIDQLNPEIIQRLIREVYATRAQTRYFLMTRMEEVYRMSLADVGHMLELTGQAPVLSAS